MSLASCLAFACPAWGADEPLVLEWKAPVGSDCPSRDEVAGAVLRLTGGGATNRVFVHATVAPVGEDSWVVELESTSGGESGHRVVRGASCRLVSEATVAVLAWLIQPQPSVAATAAGKPADEPWLAFAAMGAVLDRGTLPDVALGGGLRVGLGRSGWQVAVRAAWFPDGRVDAPGATGAGANFSLLVMGGDACLHRGWVSLCAGPEVARLSGRGVLVSVSRGGAATWLSAAAALRLSVPLGSRVALDAVLGTTLSRTRERFALDDLGLLHRPDAVALRAGLGASVGFP